MKPFILREWEHAKFGEHGLTREHAYALHAAACEHPLARQDATNVLVLGRDRITARQMVGVIAADGCCLEILPKIEPPGEDEAVVTQSVRNRLVQMLDIALGLDLDIGAAAAMARQDNTLLEILIDDFATKLLAQVRHGLPRTYLQYEEDLPALRGRLDVTRQFTHNAVRPDRLACRFDQLESDTPLMRIMAAAVVFLARHARTQATRHKLDELRFRLADIPVMPVSRLPWKSVRIDRTNRRWATLLQQAELFLKREWQETYHQDGAPEGLTLLFPMNDLFEKYIAQMLRRALAGSGVEVIAQGGDRACLGNFTGEYLGNQSGNTFRTKPDLILRENGQIRAIIDTKWKNLALDQQDRKQGASQADVYQMMAYGHLYDVPELILLYPERPGFSPEERHRYGIAGSKRCLRIETVDISGDDEAVRTALRKLWCKSFPQNCAPSETPERSALAQAD